MANSLQEEKNLKNEIRALKKELKDLRIKGKKIHSTFCDQLNDEKDTSSKKLSQKLPAEEHNLLNIQNKLMYDFLRFTGITCKSSNKNANEFVFQTLNEDNSVENYYIKIGHNGEEGKIEKYIMPPGIKINDLLEICPLNKSKQLPEFLNLCWHYILCFHDRKGQFKELKNKIKEIQNCELLNNDGFTCITIRFIGVYDNSNKKFLNFDTNLFYGYNERLPKTYSVCPTIVSEDTKFDESKVLILKKTFAKPFKNMKLDNGFDRMIRNTKHPFDWEPITETEHQISIKKSQSCIMEDCIDEDSIDEILDSIKEKSRKQKNKTSDNSTQNMYKENLPENNGKEKKFHKNKKRKHDQNKNKREQESSFNASGIQTNLSNTSDKNVTKYNKSKKQSTPKRRKLDPKQKILDFSKSILDAQKKQKSPISATRTVFKLQEKQASSKAKNKKLLLNDINFSSSTPLKPFDVIKKKDTCKLLSEMIAISPIGETN